MCTHWCHEDGLYTSLNPLRNNPLVEGVNTEETDIHTHTVTLANVLIISSCSGNTHSKMLCNVLSQTLYKYRGLVSIVMMNNTKTAGKV